MSESLHLDGASILQRHAHAGAEACKAYLSPEHVLKNGCGGGVGLEAYGQTDVLEVVVTGSVIVVGGLGGECDYEALRAVQADVVREGLVARREQVPGLVDSQGHAHGAVAPVVLGGLVQTLHVGVE